MTGRKLRLLVDEVNELIDWADVVVLDKNLLRRLRDNLDELFYAIPLNDDEISIE